MPVVGELQVSVGIETKKSIFIQVPSPEPQLLSRKVLGFALGCKGEFAINNLQGLAVIQARVPVLEIIC